jgi:hypothetical protein
MSLTIWLPSQKPADRPEQRKFNALHMSMPYFHMTHFNIISPSTAICPKRSLHLRHYHRSFVSISPPRPQHVALFILVRPNKGNDTVKHVRDFRFSQRYWDFFCDNTVYTGIQVVTFRRVFLPLSSR